MHNFVIFYTTSQVDRSYQNNKKSFQTILKTEMILFINSLFSFWEKIKSQHYFNKKKAEFHYRIIWRALVYTEVHYLWSAKEQAKGWYTRAVSTTSVQILVSKHHSPQVTTSLLREIIHSRAVAEKNTKWAWNIFWCQKGGKCSKNSNKTAQVNTLKKLPRANLGQVEQYQ